MLTVLGTSVLACVHAFRANVPTNPGTLHVYASAYLRAHVPRFAVCPHALRSYLSLSTHLPYVSTSMYNCVLMHLISTVLKTLSDKGTDQEST